jgi:hypothetical protein
MVVFMIFFYDANIFGPVLPGGSCSLSLISLTSYFGFVGARASWLDKKRTPLDTHIN